MKILDVLMNLIGLNRSMLIGSMVIPNINAEILREAMLKKLNFCNLFSFGSGRP